ncbi:TAF4-domain-containing protein [Fistulina hepatica ATCC 64428]|uniref:Transcription initiation factor TFIID subunit 4 n=1 Tax=Fistulina hepatica ATCC 64428 TaxID=1128425 RepID=A0A0D7AE39_9AGAR|nr:TAF4-domain-containing protein [Fistulina hepatica ATCC 64428]
MSQVKNDQTAAQATPPQTTATPYTVTHVSQTPQTSAATAAPRPVVAATSAAALDTADVSTLNDALGSAGVDLKAEEEGLQRGSEYSSYRSYADNSRKQPAKPAFSVHHLSAAMRDISAVHKVTSIPEDSVNYLALALRARLQDLVTEMISAAKHRTDAQFDRPASFYTAPGSGERTPMWSIVVRRDVAKQIAVIERASREEEQRIRRERQERADLAASQAAAAAAAAAAASTEQTQSADPATQQSEWMSEDGANPKKRRKKDQGPGVTAKNMSEDVRKKMSNAVATQAAGLGGRYAWMTAANASAATPPRPRQTAAASVPSSTANAASPAPTTTATASSWSRPYSATSVKRASPAAIPIATTQTSTQPSATTTSKDDGMLTVTMKDAVFAIGKERGHGGGRGAARAFV